MNSGLESTEEGQNILKKTIDQTTDFEYNTDIDSKNYVQDGRGGWATDSECESFLNANDSDSGDLGVVTLRIRMHLILILNANGSHLGEYE